MNQEEIDEVNENLREVLMEMANAPQKYTGISGVVYFCTKEEMRNKQAHSLGRVKLIKDDKEAYCSIKKGSDGKRISNGDKRLVKDLLDFVELNEELLWRYWNTPAIEADSAETMQSFKKI